MTVYNINLGIGWASSGVEYAQAYRSTIFKNTGIKAKFVFMDMFLQDNLSDLVRNMGFSDEDIEKILSIDDLAKGDDLFFAATGITEGNRRI